MSSSRWQADARFSGARRAGSTRLAALLLTAAMAMPLTLALVTLLPAATGDTIADRELGQPDFVHKVANTVDGSGESGPVVIAVDRSSTPNHLYLADSGNNRVLGWRNSASFADGASADLVIGQPDFFSAGANTGGVSANTLSGPDGVAVDSKGNLFVADGGNNRVLEYSAPITGCVGFPCVGGAAKEVFGQVGDFTSSSCNLGGNAVASADTLCAPQGVALDSHDDLYIADTSNDRVLEYITPLTVSATAGSGDSSADLVIGQGAAGNNFTGTVCNINNTSRSATSLCGVRGVAVDGSNHLYVGDGGNNRVLEYTEAANPPTNVTANKVFGQSGSFTSGTANNGGISADSLNAPAEVAVDTANDLYVADRSNSRVLEYDTPLTTDTTADRVFGQLDDFGSSSCNLGGTEPAATTLCLPQGVALDTTGDLFVADFTNNRVLAFHTPLSKTIADVELGQPDFAHKAANTVDGEGESMPSLIAVDRSSTPNRLYLADASNNRVLGWRNAAAFVNGASADLVIGQPDFFSALANTGGLSADTLSGPDGVAVDSKGNLYVADGGNNRVLEYSAPIAGCAGFPCVGGAAKEVFGQVGDFTSSSCNLGGNAVASADTLCAPQGLALDGHDDLYVADTTNNRVLEYITPLTVSVTAGSGDTVADLVIGQGAGGSNFTATGCNIDGNPANRSARSLCSPRGVAVDTNNNLYVGDSSNNRVLEYTEAANPPTNVAANKVFGQGGSFTSGTSNNGGISPDSLSIPYQVALDTANDLYVADRNNNRVLEYDTPLSTDTTADRVFGQADNFASNQCNLGGTTPSADTLCLPQGVALDAAGDLLVGDSSNNRVLEYDKPLVLGPTPTPTATIPATPSATATATASATATATATPTATATSTSGTPTATATATATNTATPTATSTATGTATPTATATATVTATPTATPTPILGTLSFKPTALNFGIKTKVGKASKAKKVTIKNTSSKSSKISVTLKGESTTTPFAIKGAQCIKTLAPGKSCKVSVTFTPSDTTPQVGSLTVNDNAQGAPQMIPLSGTGQ